MGAWGGWALAPNIAMGRNYRSHMNWSPKGSGTFKTGGEFFWRPERGFEFAALSSWADGPSTVAGVRFFGGHRGDRRIRGTDGRQLLLFGGIFAGLCRLLVRLLAGFLGVG